MFRSKVMTIQVQTSVFLRLDKNALFFILSLLPTLKDRVHVVSASKSLRVYFSHRQFWQHQLKHDLYVQAPPSTKNIGLFYKERLVQISNERKTVLVYLGAYRFVTSIGGVDKQQKYERIAGLKQALASGTKKVFFDTVNKPTYGRQMDLMSRNSKEIQLWNQMLDKNNVLIAQETLKPIKQLADKTTQEFSQSLAFFMMALAITNAHTTLYQIIHQLAPAKQKLLLDRTGADMLCCAASMGHLETVKLLLDSGVNPNEYGLYLDANEKLNPRRLLALPFYFLHELQKQQDGFVKRSTVIMEMMKLFLKHGANVDLPATQEVGAALEENAARQSMRAMAQQYLDETEVNKSQYKSLEFRLLQESLKKISQASKLQQQVENRRVLLT